MGKMKEPNFRARQLGRTLRRLRKQAGLDQTDVADRMRCNPSNISRREAGQVPDYPELQMLLDIYGVIVSDWDEYIRIWERALEKGRWHAYGLGDRGFISLEAEAYQLGYIPGLLQTAAYMRAGFTEARRPMKGEDLEIAIVVRQQRQRRLTEESVLRLHAVIDESVLLRPILAREERKAQLGQIIEYSGLPSVTVQVLPLSCGAHSGRTGSFTILSYAEPEEPDIAYIEHGFGSLQIEKADEVALARLVFDHFADIALDEQNSIALIERMVADV
ncbi:MAG: helix-turn-helix domain-containing protein [Pseudonocardiaceae bacterium]|nr:helix-turn-helix domain-containing protein [Pseudonocardiaceae bacterium]